MTLPRKNRWAFGCGNLQDSESAETSLEAEPSWIMGGCVLAWHGSLSGTNYTENNSSDVCICIHDIRFSKCPIKHFSIKEMFASSVDLMSAWPFWWGRSCSWYCWMPFVSGPRHVLLVVRTRCFHCLGLGSVPDRGCTSRDAQAKMHKPRGATKKKKRKRSSWKLWKLCQPVGHGIRSGHWRKTLRQWVLFKLRKTYSVL